MSLPTEPGGFVAQGLRFHDLVFDHDLVGAVRDDGAVLRLTRQERALIRHFVAHANRLLSREQLLSALSDDPDVLDRNVDFIVNRLRRKLRDPARKPRFIATQYGEGYVWIAEPKPLEPAPLILVIGPLLGAPEVIARESVIQLMARLQTAFEERTAPGRVVVRPAWRPSASAQFRFSLEVSLRLERGALQAALTLRQEPGRTVIGVRRIDAAEAIGKTEAGSLATTMMALIWRHLTVGLTDTAAPTDAPIAVRIHDAVKLLSPADDEWIAIAPKLASDRAASPEDPHTAIIWATHLAARLMRARAGDPADPATYAPIEDEIEGLAFASLPAIRREPAFALAAANLLLGVHRGHADLAEKLALSVLESSPAFAMAFPVLGLIEAERGDLESALTRYEEALRLCEPETEFEVFLLVHKVRTLIAKGDRDAADTAFNRIKRIKPLAGRQLGLFYIRPGDENLTPEIRLRLGQLKGADARRLIGLQYYVIARRFGMAAHRRNIMAGPLDHLIRRFGEAVVPEALRSALAE